MLDRTIAAIKGNVDSTYSLQGYLRSNPSLLTQIDSEGNTLLHIAAKCNHSFIEPLIDLLGDRAHQIAKTHNNDGKLPLSYLITSKKMTTFYAQSLEHYTSSSFLKSICEPIDSALVLSSLLIPASSLLSMHVKIACIAINEVRKVIQSSETHPSANDFDADKIEQVENKIETMRDEYEKETHLAILNIQHKTLNKLAGLNICAKKITAAQVGNCGEYSFLTLQKLRTFHPDLLIEIFELDPGDHSIVVIGREPNLDPSKDKPNDYTTWGPNAVVCDAWAGDAYPATQIPTKLYCYWNYYSSDKDKNINATSLFNPNYHKLELFFYLDKNAEQLVKTLSPPNQRIVLALPPAPIPANESQTIKTSKDKKRKLGTYADCNLMFFKRNANEQEIISVRLIKKPKATHTIKILL